MIPVEENKGFWDANMYLVSTKSNLHVTVSDVKTANVFFNISAGSASFDILNRPFRRSKDAIKLLGARVLSDLVEKDIKTIKIFFKGARFSRMLFLREILRTGKVAVVGCFDISPVPHNGCRRRKKARYKHRYKKVFI